MNYYLAGKSIDIYRIKHLQDKLDIKKQLAINKNNEQSNNEIDWILSDIPELKPDQLTLIKEYLESGKVKEIVSKMIDEPKIIGSSTNNKTSNDIVIDRLPFSLDIDKITETEIQYLKKFKLVCDKCTKSYNECNNILSKIELLLDENKEQIKTMFDEQNDIQPCIAKKILENII